jgi:tetratricopeptide (TPR) repeat protein
VRILFLISILSASTCFGQFADPSFYLVDTLKIEELDQQDLDLLGEELKKFHDAKEDSNRVIALSDIVENLYHNSWKGYNEILQIELYKILASKTLSTREKYLYKDLLAIAINEKGLGYKRTGDYDKAELYYLKSLSIHEDIGDSLGVSSCYNNLGILFDIRGKATIAISYYQKSMDIKIALNDQEGLTTTYNNLGFVYSSQGMKRKAISYYEKSLDISQKIGKQSSIATSLNNLAHIYGEFGDNHRALQYYLKSLEIDQKTGNPEYIASSLNNVASKYRVLGEIDKALEYHERSLEICKNQQDRSGIALSYNNLGFLYEDLGKLDSALHYYRLSFTIRESLKNQDMIASILVNLGRVEFSLGSQEQARTYAERSLKIGHEIGYPDLIKDAAKLLVDIYEKDGDFQRGLSMHKLFVEMRDSLDNLDAREATIQQRTRYEYIQKSVSDSIKYDIQKKVQEELHRNKMVAEQAVGDRLLQQQWMLIGGVVLLVIFGLFVLNRLNVSQKTKRIIQEQKEEVEKQKLESEHQKDLLEVRNREITDSIQYAKRLQQAILPSAQLIRDSLKDSFVLYLPKDIIAGDFYWLENYGGKTFFAVADCTGHGVPGAMVSVVCSGALSQALMEEGITDPGKILDRTRELVVDKFEIGGEEVRDGMDIALCVMEHTETGIKLEFAGANNALWIVKQYGRVSALDDLANTELIEVKGDKQPIGLYDHPKPFQTQHLALNIGDTMYLSSDGFADQFGGDKGKKLKSANFKKLLQKHADLPISSQSDILLSAFDDWKGGYEQLDDVCVIGIRV